MQPIPADISPDDLWQWLNGAWFLWRLDNGDLTPATLDRGGRRGTMEVYPLDGPPCSWDAGRAFLHWPRCDAVNMAGYAVIVERIAQRQYRRSFSARCCHVTIPRRWDVLKKYPEAGHVTLEDYTLVKELFNPTYPTYGEALERIEKGAVSVALTPHIILVSDGTVSAVYYRGKAIGEIRDDRLYPFDDDNSRVLRVLKFFDGRVAYAA